MAYNAEARTRNLALQREKEAKDIRPGLEKEPETMGELITDIINDTMIARPVAGRKGYSLDEGVIMALASCSCSIDEIAERFNVHRQTIVNNPSYKAAYDKGIASCKMNLRAKQYRRAMDGDVPMLIWLGKQLLGQRDKQELTGANGEGVNIVVSYDDKSQVGTATLSAIANAISNEEVQCDGVWEKVREDGIIYELDSGASSSW